jgi:hypothetical protein
MSLRKKASMSAYVIAWVMIERYTPVTRERKASQPKTTASRPGTKITIAAAQAKWSNPHQNQGNFGQLRKTMKSGSSGLPYTPRVPICRIRYMPMQYPPSAKKAP